MRRRWATVLACLASLLAVTPAASPCAAQTALETAIKATYLYKFAPFVGWPAAQDGPFYICIVGDDPFGTVLDQAVASQSYGSRPFQVVRMATIAHDSTCDIAYLAGSSTQDVAGALGSLRGAPVLTVTDAGAPAGIVQFAMQDGRVRFMIDDDQAEASGLNISSKMLSLALAVKGGQK